MVQSVKEPLAHLHLVLHREKIWSSCRYIDGTDRTAMVAPFRWGSFRWFYAAINSLELQSVFTASFFFWLITPVVLPV